MTNTVAWGTMRTLETNSATMMMPNRIAMIGPIKIDPPYLDRPWACVVPVAAASRGRTISLTPWMDSTTTVAPTRMGIGIFGPALDGKGNSVAGIRLLERLSQELYLSIF